MPRKKKVTKTEEVKESLSSSEEEEWEDVDENKAEVEDTDATAVKEDVEIEFELPDVVKKQQHKKSLVRQWIETLIKRAINKSRKQVYIAMHEVHLLCYLSIGFCLNEISNDDLLKAAMFSMLPQDLDDKSSKKISLDKVTRINEWVAATFEWKSSSLSNNGISKLSVKKSVLLEIIAAKRVEQKIDCVLLHLLVYRLLGLQSRLVMNIQPISYKPPTPKQLEEKAKKLRAVMEKLEKNKNTANITMEGDIPQLDGTDDSKSSYRRSKKQLKKPVVKPGQTSAHLKENQTEGTVVSKYDFKQRAKSCTEEKNISRKTRSKLKLQKKVKVELTDCERSLSPAKKLSKMANGDCLVTSRSDLTNVQAPVAGDQPPNKKKTSRQQRGAKAKLTAVEDKRTRTKKKRGEKLTSKRDMESTKVASGGARKLRARERAAVKQEKVDDASDFVASSSDDADSDFEEELPPKKIRRPVVTSPRGSVGARDSKTKKTASKSKSSRSNSKNSSTINEWLEVYVPKLGWVHVDCVSGKMNDPRVAESSAASPVHYVVAFDNDNCVKDVTARYASNWLTATRKLRVTHVEPDWWKETLAPYKTKNEKLDVQENKALESELLAQPLPASISAFKDHPLFALRRHLLKYESIYPPDTPALGYIRGEEVLPRSSIHVLHTREKWLQSAFSVRDGEEPYKMVASFMLNRKLNRDSGALSLALFGKWQTEPFKPPVAKDGKVPRNEYGNVDLFQPSMLPIGCVHLQLPGLHTVARKLDIDVCTAIVGFDTHHGFPHPVTDGYVACKEFESVLRDAWTEDQAHAAERAKAKRESRIYSNWKKLIRGALALHRVRSKYTDKENEKDRANEIQATSKVAWQAKRLEEAKQNEQSTRTTRRGTKKKKRDESLPFEVETM